MAWRPNLRAGWVAASKGCRFDPEFRAGAVRVVKEAGKPVAQVAQVARDLGINPHTLNDWTHMDRRAARLP